MRKATTAFSIGLAGLGLLPFTVGQAQRSSASYTYQVYQGRAALAQKHWRSAESSFRYALVWSRHGPEAHTGLGYVYLHLGEKQRAVEEFNIALLRRPHFTWAERGLHMARSSEEAEAAFHALTEQVKQEPNDANLHTTFAEELLERNRVDEAKREAGIALRIAPGMGHAYSVFGRAAAQQDNDAEAQRYLETAIKRDNTDDTAYAALGDLAMKARDYRQAVNYYRQLVRLLPDETEGHRKLLEALLASGDTKGAEKEKARIVISKELGALEE
jgi:tetratricopeptide (TPR) repeat protein